MRKSAIVCLLGLALLLSGASQVFAGPVMDRVLEKGELVVGITGTQPPLNMVTKSGKIIGMDADLAHLIAANLGVKVSFNKLPFEELLPAVEKGKVDIVISNFSMTLERNRKVAFVGPYLASGKGILTKQKLVEQLQTKEGLNTPDMTVAVLRNSTSQEYVEKSSAKAKIVATGTLDMAVNMLLDDKVDAVVADYPFCSFTAFRHKDQGLVAGESSLSYEPLGFAVQEDALLINWLGNFIETIKGTGVLNQVHNRWFKGGDWLKELP
jgi:polar amino acid transport system substrate-binding protein